MKHIKLNPLQPVELWPTEGASIENALKEARELCREHGLVECELRYKGFLFGIEQDSNLDELLRDYNYWLEINRHDPLLED